MGGAAKRRTTTSTGKGKGKGNGKMKLVMSRRGVIELICVVFFLGGTIPLTLRYTHFAGSVSDSRMKRGREAAKGSLRQLVRGQRVVNAQKVSLPVGKNTWNVPGSEKATPSIQSKTIMLLLLSDQ